MTSAIINGIVPSCKVVQAGSVAAQLLREVSHTIPSLGKTPLLVGFLANQDDGARSYAEWTSRTCREK